MIDSFIIMPLVMIHSVCLLLRDKGTTYIMYKLTSISSYNALECMERSILHPNLFCTHSYTSMPKVLQSMLLFCFVFITLMPASWLALQVVHAPNLIKFFVSNYTELFFSGNEEYPVARK